LAGENTCLDGVLGLLRLPVTMDRCLPGTFGGWQTVTPELSPPALKVIEAQSRSYY